jgi:hypothetical protein
MRRCYHRDLCSKERMMASPDDGSVDPASEPQDYELWEIEAERQVGLALALQLARGWPFEMEAYLRSEFGGIDPHVAAVLEASLQAETDRRIAVLELEFVSEGGASGELGGS